MCFIGGLIALVTGLCPPAFVFVFWGAILLLGTVYERVRYKPIETATPGAGWTRTDERFIDDETGAARDRVARSRKRRAEIREGLKQAGKIFLRLSCGAAIAGVIFVFAVTSDTCAGILRAKINS